MNDKVRELQDEEIDAAAGGGQRFDPYKNFKFRVQVQPEDSHFDGKLLTAHDLRREQDY